MFIDQCKSIPNVTRYIFETANPEFQQHLEQLQFERLDGNKWTLSLEKLNTLAVIKKDARSDWHKKRHDELKEHLTKTLSNIAKPLDITDKQRLVLVQEFMRRHRKDVGSVPFIGALVGCLKYQLQNKHQVVEWRMNESVLTQNNEEPMEDYVRLLTGVLGFQLLYRDDADDDSDNIIIDIDDEPVHIWRMNPNLDNQFIRSALKCLPSQHNLIDYQLSSVERKPPQTIFQWICSAFTHCLSFLH
ncbi:hypothetical protein EDC94DRAFT_616390 [Helicostylum pulchrum]|nr:hypothetical protein EDC94DRAFT_616390 [Helicostylum pulchrum]